MGINAFMIWFALYGVILEMVIEWVMTIITTMTAWVIHQCVNVVIAESITTLICGWDALERIIMMISVKTALRGHYLYTKFKDVTIWLCFVATLSYHNQ